MATNGGIPIVPDPNGGLPHHGEGRKRSSNKQSVTFSLNTDDQYRRSPSPGLKTTTLRSAPRTDNSPVNMDCILLTLKLALGALFFVIVLVSSVLSKLTLVSLTDSLRHYTWDMHINNTKKDFDNWKKKGYLTEVVSLYWQLLLILMVPSGLTFFRCLFFGYLGKTNKSYPWPKGSAVLLGLVGSVVEVIALSTLVFLVLTELTPGVAILTLNGVFLIQISVDTYTAFRNRACVTDNCNVRRRTNRQGYLEVEQDDNAGEERPGEPNRKEEEEVRYKYFMKFLKRLQCIQEHYVVKVIAALLQIGGVMGLIVFWAATMRTHKKDIVVRTDVYYRPLIGLPFVLLALSFVWSNRFQERIARSNERMNDKEVSARYKSSLINSSVRLLLYPFVTYLVFRYLTPFHPYIDPWCLHDKCHITFSGNSLNEMIVHIVLSFVGYFIVWVSCTMTLSQVSVGIPLLLSTPIATAVYYIVINTKGDYTHNFFPTFFNDSVKDFGYFLPGSPCIASLLWIAEVLAMGFYICVKTNIILAKDSDMFLTPHYDSIFLEQHTILNRQVQKGDGRSLNEDFTTNAKHRNPRMIFICSTMYRENETEMRQMLSSIWRVAQHYEREYQRNRNCCDRYESHIFFDGAINANQIENFGLQLLSLLEDTLNVRLQRAIKKKTPYGYRLSWNLGIIVGMPFYVHFKDKTLVKPKKRWSQVMYMNYVIHHRINEERPRLNPDDTFILTTDADIDFKASSVVVLLDMMASNVNVAAVSARTHPKGHGLVYWYQLFDYAIGHWFQKPAEHILGSVLCSPGCFSVFRCSALKLVLDEYSTEVTNASEFLKKDMGEDRWLCTLLVKQGLRLEYCAISEDYTYCPTDFDEFYKQRRRWIPSTLANLVMLVSESGIITRGNDSISILYILFQVIMVFSTAISPATVILIIAAGLDTFNVPYALVITVLFLVAFLYGVICLYASPKTQLDVAKILTFVFSLIMSVVMIGIVKDIIDGIVGEPDKTPIGPPDGCSQFLNGDNVTKAYLDCMKAHDFAVNATNGLDHHFTMPVSFTVIYLGGLTVTFILAAFCHPRELGCLLHGVWYLLGLPSGYLLLLIYSAANLCDRSWGTREQHKGGDEGIWGWRVYVIWAWNKLTSLWCCVKCCWGGVEKGKGGGGGGKAEEGKAGGGKKEGEESQEDPGKESGKESGEVRVTISEEQGAGEGKREKDGGEVREKEGACGTSDDGPAFTQSSLVPHVGMDQAAKDWLVEQECEDYVENFEAHGYTNKHFIANMTAEDFEAIGIDKRGFILRLEKAAKILQRLEQDPNFFDVREWLKSLEMEEYLELFHQEGYKRQTDISNLKQLDEGQLKAIGVVKRGHLQRLVKAIEHLSTPPVKYSSIDQDTLEWLRNNDCEEYVEHFIKHGYTNKHFLAGIKAKDLKEIGIDKKGFRLRLEKAAQNLAPLNIKVDIPHSVEEWLANLELSEYTQLFHREGYKSAEDIVNLKDLDQKQLKAMGVTKKAHLQRLKVALASLAIPSQLELNKRRTQTIVENMRCTELRDMDDTEAAFWEDLIRRKLEPVSIKFTQNKDVQKSLESLRNSVLALLLLVNLMWIVLLSSLTFWQLQRYSIDPQAFQLLFLAVYGIIMVIQFCTMLAHRAVTLAHYLGRVSPREISINPWQNYNDGFQLVSVQEIPIRA